MINNTSPSLELCLFQFNASIYVTCSYKKLLLINLFKTNHIFQNVLEEPKMFWETLNYNGLSSFHKLGLQSRVKMLMYLKLLSVTQQMNVSLDGFFKLAPCCNEYQTYKHLLIQKTKNLKKNLKLQIMQFLQCRQEKLHICL